MNSITVDTINIQTHKRYAEDQKALDTQLIRESKEVFAHPEITGTTSIFFSHWAALFGLNLLNPPWALFSPPPRFNQQSKRFFSYRIIPNLELPVGDSTEDKDEDPKKKKRKEYFKKLVLVQEADRKDKSILLELFDTIEELDGLLSHILSKKLQYHKG